MILMMLIIPMIHVSDHENDDDGSEFYSDDVANEGNYDDNDWNDDKDFVANDASVDSDAFHSDTEAKANSNSISHNDEIICFIMLLMMILLGFL